LYQIRLLGGEPLLHPDIMAFCAATRYAFPRASIEIVTNGILLPTMPQKFFDGLKKYDVGIYLSDYNLSPKIRECL
jgi:molybdenum cofactor biosynthesis enzyme MoaA